MLARPKTTKRKTAKRFKGLPPYGNEHERNLEDRVLTPTLFQPFPCRKAASTAWLNIGHRT
jgi:hypothetical protein